MVGAMARIAAMRPELTNRSQSEDDSGLLAEAHYVANRRVVFTMAADQWFWLSTEIDAETCHGGYVTASCRTALAKMLG